MRVSKSINCYQSKNKWKIIKYHIYDNYIKHNIDIIYDSHEILS